MLRQSWACGFVKAFRYAGQQQYAPVALAAVHITFVFVQTYKSASFEASRLNTASCELQEERKIGNQLRRLPWQGPQNMACPAPSSGRCRVPCPSSMHASTKLSLDASTGLQSGEMLLSSMGNGDCTGAGVAFPIAQGGQNMW